MSQQTCNKAIEYIEVIRKIYVYIFRKITKRNGTKRNTATRSLTSIFRLSVRVLLRTIRHFGSLFLYTDQGDAQRLGHQDIH